jgi:hypothetical protein
MNLDIGITQGSYWGGAQIPYWLYMVITIFPITGLLGLDHLILRSPKTFILKLLTMIPLLGFWYFYDIGQVVGERELVEKYGLGVPYYGPIALGAGMFINKDSKNLAPADVPKPWIFMAYVLVSIIFIAFPLNKLVIGDYWGAGGQLGMYFFGIFTFGITILLAIFWGLYDIFRILFDTRGLFEKGAVRIFPATKLMDPYFNKGALGPTKALPKLPETLFEKTVDAVTKVPLTAAQAASTITSAYGKAVAGVVGAAGQVTKDAVEAADASTIGLIKEGAKDTQELMGTVTGAVTNVVGATAGTVTKTAEATGGLLDVVTKLPGILEKVGSAGPPKQTGGAMMDSASTSSTLLLFSVAVAAFGGYVLYTMKKTLGSGINVESDDPPPNPGTVRKTSETS